MTPEAIRAALLALARDVRRPRPAEWTEEEANERIARQLERLAEHIKSPQHSGC